MVISFLMFFVFVTFLLVYVKPYGRSEEIGFSDSILNGLKKDFFDLTSGEVAVVFVNVEIIQNAKCFNLENFPGMNNIFLIKDSEGNKVNARLDGNILNVESSNQNFYFYISSKPGISNLGDFICNTDMARLYEIGSIDKKNVTIRSKLGELSKESFDVPETIGFQIKEVGGEWVLGGEPPEEVNVFAKTYFFKFWDDVNKEIINKEFLFRIW